MGQTSSRVAVVGAGPGGITAAALLRKLPGVSVRIFESQSQEAWTRQRAFPLGLWAPACNVLESLGVKSSGSVCKAVPGGCYVNPQGWVLAQPSSEVLNQGGGALRFFSNEAELLQSVADSQDLQIEYGHRCLERRAEGGVVLETAAGREEYDADFVVLASGAEGAKKLRRRGYVVYRGLSSEPLPPVFPTLAFQTWGPGMRFAAVPLLQGSAWYATLLESHPLTKRFPPHQDLGRDCVEEFRSAFAFWHRPIDELLRGTVRVAAASALASPFPWEPGKAGSGRTAFVGDAAYTFDPILAVGAGEAICSAADLVSEASKQHKASGSIDADALWSSLGQRRLRRTQTLATLSNVAETLGQTSLGKARDLDFFLTPGPLKRAVFDWSIRQLATE